MKLAINSYIFTSFIQRHCLCQVRLHSVESLDDTYMSKLAGIFKEMLSS